MKSVAIIGTKDHLDEKGFQRLYNLARRLVKAGIRVRTGGAFQSDQAAMEGAASVDPGMLDVFLPWESYNKEIIPAGANTFTYDEQSCPNWTRSVDEYHPNPGSLTRGSRALHARNYGIIMYPAPVDFVVAHPRNATGNLGGTGQGMRIAEAMGIKIYNMQIKDDRLALKVVLDALK